MVYKKIKPVTREKRTWLIITLAVLQLFTYSSGFCSQGGKNAKKQYEQHLRRESPAPWGRYSSKSQGSQKPHWLTDHRKYPRASMVDDRRSKGKETEKCKYSDHIIEQLRRHTTVMPGSGLCGLDGLAIQRKQNGYRAEGRQLLSKEVFSYWKAQEHTDLYKAFSAFVESFEADSTTLEKKLDLYKSLGSYQNTVKNFGAVDFSLIATALHCQIIVYYPNGIWGIKGPAFMVFAGEGDPHPDVISAEKFVEKHRVEKSDQRQRLFLLYETVGGEGHFNALVPLGMKPYDEEYYSLQARLITEKPDVAELYKTRAIYCQRREETHQDQAEYLELIDSFISFGPESYSRAMSSGPVQTLSPKPVGRLDHVCTSSIGKRGSNCHRKNKTPAHSKAAQSQMITHKTEPLPEVTEIPQSDANSTCFQVVLPEPKCNDSLRRKVTVSQPGKGSAKTEVGCHGLSAACDEEAVISDAGVNLVEKLQEPTKDAANEPNAVVRDQDDGATSVDSELPSLPALICDKEEPVCSPVPVPVPVPVPAEVDSGDSELKAISENEQGLEKNSPDGAAGLVQAGNLSESDKIATQSRQPGRPQKSRSRKKRKKTQAGLPPEDLKHENTEGPTDSVVSPPCSLVAGFQNIIKAAVDQYKSDRDFDSITLFIFYCCDLFHLKDATHWKAYLSDSVFGELDRLVCLVAKQKSDTRSKDFLAWLRQELLKAATGSIRPPKGNLPAGYFKMPQIHRNLSAEMMAEHKNALRCVERKMQKTESLSIQFLLQYHKTPQKWVELTNQLQQLVLLESGLSDADFSRWLPVYSLYSLCRLGKIVALYPYEKEQPVVMFKESSEYWLMHGVVQETIKLFFDGCTVCLAEDPVCLADKSAGISLGVGSQSHPKTTKHDILVTNKTPTRAEPYIWFKMAMGMLNVNASDDPGPISAKYVDVKKLNKALVLLEQYDGAEHDCRVLDISIKAHILYREGGLTKNIARWTVEIIAPLMELAEENYAAAELLGSILPLLDGSGTVNSYLHLPYLIRLFDFWKGRTPEKVFYLAADFCVEKKNEIFQMLRAHTQGKEYRTSFRDSTADLWSLAFKFINPPTDLNELEQELFKRTIPEGGENQSACLWSFLYLLLEGYRNDHRIDSYLPVIKQLFEKEMEQSDRKSAAKTSFCFSYCGVKKHITCTSRDIETSLLFGLVSLDPEWLQLAESRVREVFCLQPEDEEKKPELVASLLVRTWSLFRDPDRVAMLGRVYDESKSTDCRIAGAEDKGRYLHNLAGKWRAENPKRACTTCFTAYDRRHSSKTKGASDSDHGSRDELKFAHEKIVTSIKQLTGVEPGDECLPVEQLTRLEWLHMPQRQALAARYLWQALQQLRPVIVTFMLDQHKELNLYDQFSGSMSTPEDEAVISHLRQASELGNGLADLVLALIYISRSPRCESESAFRVQKERSAKIILHLRRAAIKGHRQALSLLFQLMVNNPSLADLAGFWTLLTQAEMNDLPDHSMTVNLLVSDKQAKGPPRCYSTAPGMWQKRENIAVADVLIRAARAQTQGERTQLLTPLIDAFSSRLDKAERDLPRFSEYVTRFLLLSGIAGYASPDLFQAYKTYHDELFHQKEKVSVFRGFMQQSSYRSAQRFIRQLPDFKQVEKKAGYAINDIGLLIDVMLNCVDSQEIFCTLWKEWLDYQETYFVSGPVYEDSPETYFEVLSGAGCLWDRQAVLMAMRLHEFQDVLIATGKVSKPELNIWIKHLLWRGVLCGSADAPSLWFQWFGEDDEPDMANLAVQRYIEKMVSLDPASERGKKLLSKILTFARNLSHSSCLAKLKTAFQKLPDKLLTLVQTREIETVFGFDTVIPDVGEQLILLVTEDREFTAAAPLVTKLLRQNGGSPTEVSRCLEILKQCRPGKLDRDKAEAVIGHTLVLVASELCLVNKTQNFLVSSDNASELVKLLLIKAQEYKDADAGVVWANQHCEIPRYLDVESGEEGGEQSNPDWLENVVCPLVESAAKTVQARKVLTNILLSWPDLRHLPVLVTLHSRAYAESRIFYDNNFPSPFPSPSLSPALISDLSEPVRCTETMLENIVKYGAIRESTEYFEISDLMETVVKLGQQQSMLPFSGSSLSQIVDKIGQRLGHSSAYQHSWEYLDIDAKSMLVTCRMLQTDEAANEANEANEVNEVNVISLAEKYGRQGNVNPGLGVLYQCIKYKKPNVKAILGLERIMLASFGVQGDLPERHALLPVRLLCLTAPLYLQPQRLTFVAGQYIRESERVNARVNLAKEKGIFLLERAAFWGGEDAHMLLCELLKENPELYRNQVWRYLRYVFNQSLIRPGYLKVWHRVNVCRMQDPVFAEAYDYFIRMTESK